MKIDLTKGFALQVRDARRQYRRCPKYDLISGLCRNPDGAGYYVVFSVFAPPVGLLYVRMELENFKEDLVDDLGKTLYLRGAKSLDTAHFGGDGMDALYWMTAGTVTLLEVLETAGIFEQMEKAEEKEILPLSHDLRRSGKA